MSVWNRASHIQHTSRQVQASVAAERPQTRDAAAADAPLLHYRDSHAATNASIPLIGVYTSHYHVGGWLTLRLPQPPHAESTGAVSWHVSDGWRVLPHHLPKDKLWSTIVAEAQHDAVCVGNLLAPCRQQQQQLLQANEPALASFLHTSIIMHASPERSLSFFLGNKLSSPTLLGVQLTRLFLDAFTDDPVRAILVISLHGCCALRHYVHALLPLTVNCGGCTGRHSSSARPRPSLHVICPVLALFQGFPSHPVLPSSTLDVAAWTQGAIQHLFCILYHKLLTMHCTHT